MRDAHVFADREDAAERYLLGQMSASDRDAYEQHFFGCAECAQEVKATAAFMDSCRTVLFDRPRAASLASRHQPRAKFPRTAAAVLTGALAATVAVIVYQNVVTIPRLRSAMAPRALAAVSFVAANARGAGTQTIAVPRGQPFLIVVDIPPTASDAYDCTIVAKDGGAVVALPISAAQAQDAVSVLIPAGQLAPGDYTLVITGRPRRVDASPVDVARFPFTLRYAD